MDQIRELYTKYDNLVKYSVYAFTGWGLSWVIFFIMLPFMIRYYGKIRGASLNYGFSWFSMVAIILGLEFGLRPWKSLDSSKYNRFERTLLNSNFQTYKIQRISSNDFIAENISFENRKFQPKTFIFDPPKLAYFDPPKLDIFISSKNVHFALCAWKF